MTQHTISIEKIVHGGLGLGRLESGVVCLVPYVAPGEKVLVRETKKRRGYVLAEMIDILKPSPDRVEPVCPWYYQCGGCNLQHINYEAQLQVKRNIVKESLQRGGVTLNNGKVLPVIHSSKKIHYRNRIRLKVSPEGALGFYRFNTNEIVEIDQCPVASEPLNCTLQELRNTNFTSQLFGKISEIELLHSPADDRIFCLLHPRNYKFPDQNIPDATQLKNIQAITLKTKSSAEKIEPGSNENSLFQNFDASSFGHPYSLQWTPGCFSQVNAKQNEQLVNIASNKAGDVAGKQVLDLYCGTGNFSIPFALQGAVVTGIEYDEESIRQADNNANRLGVSENTRFIVQDVNKWLQKASKRSYSFDVIIMDPPRQGLGKNITVSTIFNPARILYISCDPATLARDVKLLQNEGFTISDVTPVDMFPQTHHIESIALLEKN